MFIGTLRIHYLLVYDYERVKQRVQLESCYCLLVSVDVDRAWSLRLRRLGYWTLLLSIHRKSAPNAHKGPSSTTASSTTI